MCGDGCVACTACASSGLRCPQVTPIGFSVAVAACGWRLWCVLSNRPADDVSLSDVVACFVAPPSTGCDSDLWQHVTFDHLLVGWLIVWLVDLLTDWLAGWFILVVYIGGQHTHNFKSFSNRLQRPRMMHDVGDIISSRMQIRLRWSRVRAAAKRTRLDHVNILTFCSHIFMISLMFIIHLNFLFQLYLVFASKSRSSYEYRYWDLSFVTYPPHHTTINGLCKRERRKRDKREKEAERDTHTDYVCNEAQTLLLLLLLLGAGRDGCKVWGGVGIKIVVDY